MWTVFFWKYNVKTEHLFLIKESSTFRWKSTGIPEKEGWNPREESITEDLFEDHITEDHKKDPITEKTEENIITKDAKEDPFTEDTHEFYDTQWLLGHKKLFFTFLL